MQRPLYLPSQLPLQLQLSLPLPLPLLLLLLLPLPLPLLVLRRHPERSEGPPYWPLLLLLLLPLLLPFCLSFRAQRGTCFPLAQRAPVLAFAFS